MTCDQIYELLSAKLDGELSEQEETQLQAHLDGCAECRRLYEAMASIEENTAALEQPAPAGIKQGVMYRIGQESGTVKRSKRRFWGFGTGIGLAAAVAVLLIGTNVIRVPSTVRKKAPSAPISAQYEAGSTEMAQQTAPAETQQFAVPNEAQDDWRYDAEPENWMDGKPTPSYYGVSESQASAAQIQEPAAEPDSAGMILSPFTQIPDIVEPLDPDPYYYHNGTPGETDESDGEKRQHAQPIEPQLTMACMELSETGYAPVLLYTEFSDTSLLKLLQEEEPELYAQFEELEPQTRAQALGLEEPDAEAELPELDGADVSAEPTDPDGEAEPEPPVEERMVVYTVDYQTLLALHEWLMQNLPRSELMDEDVLQAETDTMIRLEELDPGSESLNRIITWAPRAKPIEWPIFWADDWAVRMRTAENWALFFPAEDYIPDPEDLAYLVFVLPTGEDAVLEDAALAEEALEDAASQATDPETPVEIDP